MKSFVTLSVLILLSAHGFALDNVVINEIHYNPDEDAPDEFIELYNPTDRVIDISGWAFVEGIGFQFPDGTRLEAKEYLILVQNPQSILFRRHSGEMFGPFNGRLANEGEFLMLRSPDGTVVDALDYSDSRPWSRGADGYGPSLERISPDMASDDYHAWRASHRNSGTPGSENTVTADLPRPMISSYRLDPVFPTSNDDVAVDISFDSADLIESIKLHYILERTGSSDEESSLPMELKSKSGDHITFSALIPKQESQTLVRFYVQVTRNDGKELYLPHIAEPRPFESYFVYDNEIPSKLPIMWVYAMKSISLHDGESMRVSGVVVKPLDGSVQVYDGLDIRNSRNGHKIKFLKGEEYRGDRTLNLIPEIPSGSTTAGSQSPHVEHLSYEIFEDFGVLVPRCDWYRVIQGTIHRQQILIQQPNERFLAINGRNENANIYKIAYNEPGGYSKQTNVLEDDRDLQELTAAIRTANPAARAEALHRYLDIEEVMGYDVAGVLMSNWDGFFNNMFLLHNPPPIDKWECIPWDLDKTFGYTDGDSMFVEMPLTYPLDGRAAEASRPPGFISQWFHSDYELNQTYLYRVRDALDGLFSIERIDSLIAEYENLLNEDLDLLEDYTGSTKRARRRQIEESYETMRTFVRLRHEYLQSRVPTMLYGWPLY